MGYQIGEVVTRPDRDEIKKNLMKNRDLNLEEQALMTMYAIKSYLGSLFKFGIKSEATKDALRVRKEFRRILKEEDKIFLFLLTNIYNINIDSLANMVDMLDDLNERTVEYYYRVLDDIDEAVELGDENRAKRIPKNFDTLIESKSYRQELMGLVENHRTIRDFLNYPDEFWEFMKDRYRTVEMDPETMEHEAGIAKYYDKDGNISDLVMVCPKPVDLYSSLAALRIWAEAYETYKCIGKHAALYDIKPLDDLKLQYLNHLSDKANKAFKQF